MALHCIFAKPPSLAIDGRAFDGSIGFHQDRPKAKAAIQTWKSISKQIMPYSWNPMKYRNLVVILSLAQLYASQPASAISVELAKKCREMAIKAHPTAPTGAKAGSAKAQREFYQNCIAKNGKTQ